MWGVQLYWPSGTLGSGGPEPTYINTYAVDKNPTPDEPDRPEYSYDKSGNDAGTSGKTTTGKQDDNSNIIISDKGPNLSETGSNCDSSDSFQIVKVYADLYKSNDKLVYSTDKDNDCSQDNMHYQDKRVGSPTYEQNVFVRLAGTANYLYNANKISYDDIIKNIDYYLYEYDYVSDPEGIMINASDNSSPAVTADIVMESKMKELTNFYTKVEAVGYYYTTNASRNVFITDEVDKTNNTDIPLQGYKLLAWHAIDVEERDNSSGALKQSTPYTADKWISLDTSGITDSCGGYRLDLKFTRATYPQGDLNETDYRYDPTETYHAYSRLYEDTRIDGHAEPEGYWASDYGCLNIDDASQHTLYLLYVREMPDIKTDGGDPGEPDNPGDSSTTYTTKDNHNPPNGNNPPPHIEHTWTPGQPTGGKTTNGREPFKLNIVKVYGVINPYTYEVKDDVTIYQSSNTYNVNISDEYGRTDANGDTSPYHLRAYTVTNTTPIDGIPAGTSGAYPSGSGYLASQWCDGWTRGLNTSDTSDDFSYENPDNNNLGQYNHHGFIDGYDGFSGNDDSSGAIGSLVPTTNTEPTNGTNFVDIISKHFSSADLYNPYGSTQYFINWNGGSFNTDRKSLYVYPNQGYDKTIYFGDYVDKSKEGTLYLLYLREDKVTYSSSALVIPESYITKTFDLENEASITISGNYTALGDGFTGRHEYATDEETHNIMQHRFIFKIPSLKNLLLNRKV